MTREAMTGWVRRATAAAMLAVAGCDIPDVVVADGGTLDVPAVDRAPTAPDVTTPDVQADTAVAVDVPEDTAALDVLDAGTDAGVDVSGDTAADVPWITDVAAVTDVAPVVDTSPCTAGMRLCGGACTDTGTDTAHCGACDMACAYAHATATCAAGVCALGPCQSGYGDCDGNPANGCETLLASSAAHCGACGHACVIPGAMAACAVGVCVPTTCTPGRAHCDGIAGHVCETDLTTSVTSCGVCGNGCSYPHAAAACTAGTCGLGACDTGYGNCDGLAANGCETDLRTSVGSCGHCGGACTAPDHGTVSCVAAACVTACLAGTVASGGACVPVNAPRLMAPLSTATVTRRAPVLHWQLAAGTDGARIELSRTRTFARVETYFDATGASGTPPAALSPGVWFWRAYGRAGTSLGTVPGPVWQFTVGARSAPLDSSYGSTLDVNGDGYADVAVGATARNAVYVYAGGVAGVTTTPTVTLPGPDGGLFGWVVASAGDVNGDGYADLAVGAPFAGHAYVYLGGAGGVSAVPTVSLASTDGAVSFGRSAGYAGDINRDGYADIVIGTGSDRAYVYYGGSTGISRSPSLTLSGPAGSNFGDMVVALGDVNGDGFADLAASGSAASRAYVFMGNTGSISLSPDVSLSVAGSSRLGGVVAAAGDLNGDGLNDLAVTDGTASTVLIFTGSPAGISSAASARWGADPVSFPNFSVAAGGDCNGDGYSDLVYMGIIGGRFTGIVAYGAPVLAAPAEAFFVAGGLSNTRSLGGIGDTDGDGLSDFAVGAAASDFVDLFRGNIASVHPSADVTLTIAGPGSFGWSVATVGAGLWGQFYAHWRLV